MPTRSAVRRTGRAAALAAVLGLPLLAAGCSSLPEWAGGGSGGEADGSASLHGVLVLPDATPLPATARGEVRLIDLSRSEPGRPFLLASQVVDGPLANPVPWQLRWREDADQPTGGAYAITARLVGDGMTLFHTPEPLPLAGQPMPVTVVMDAAPPPPDAGRNRYSLESMPDVTQLRQMPEGEIPRRYQDDIYDYGTSSDPLPSDALDGNRVLLPSQPN